VKKKKNPPLYKLQKRRRAPTEGKRLKGKKGNVDHYNVEEGKEQHNSHQESAALNT